jgi:diguanylate cyclase (GGDEF)-like protein
VRDIPLPVGSQADPEVPELERLRAELAAARSGQSDIVQVNEHLVLALLDAQAQLGVSLRPGTRVDRRSIDRDSLTGLPNRFLLLEQFALSIASARRTGGRLAVLFVDLDDFKQINDTLGHAVGDTVLRHAAGCLDGAVRNVDTVSRHGGDEFVVLLNDVMRREGAARIAAKMLACLAAPERIGEHVIRLGASIGISCFPDDGEDAERLIDLADAAMYKAKREGKSRYRFHDDRLASGPSPRMPRTKSILRHATTLARQEARQNQLQEANEHLLLAALGAQELQTAAERSQAEQATFLTVVAHELRNPLAPIRAAATLVSRVQAAELPRLQAIIERQVDHVARLVGDLMDLSRFNTGKLRLERRNVDFCALVSEAVDACRPAIAGRRQALHVDVSCGPLQVDADPTRLVQVLTNLLDNASKYTPAHGTLSVDVHRAGSSLVAIVADDGIGISAAVLPDVFQPFVQDAHAVQFHGAGLGIGLAVVRELVEAHGGTVVASSDGEGKGSRFVLTLPLASP